MGEARMGWVERGPVMQAVRAATQWRLLVLWVAAWWVPTAMVSVPLWRKLGELLNHSVHAQSWAGSVDVLAFGDTLAALAPASGIFAGSAIVGLLLTIALSPFLNGMAVGSALAGRSPGFGQLLRDGVVQYPRMFRLLLWSVPVYGVVAVVGAGALALADRIGQGALLESTADHAFDLAVGIVVVLCILAQIVLDAARAAFMADERLRSATRALGRGGLLLLRRPLPTLVYFLAVSIVGYAVALLLAALRTYLPRGHLLELLLAVLLAQLIVLAIGWAHIARMFALAVVARNLPEGRADSRSGVAESATIPASD